MLSWKARHKAGGIYCEDSVGDGQGMQRGAFVEEAHCPYCNCRDCEGTSSTHPRIFTWGVKEGVPQWLPSQQ